MPRYQPYLPLFAVPLALVGSISAALRIQSPTETLTRPDVNVAAVEAVAQGESGTYHFETRKVLHGEAGERLMVRMEPQVIARTEAGARYILGFTELLSDPRRRGGFMIDPLGARAVGMDDAGFALIEDTKPIRRLLETGRSNEAADLEKALKSILEQLVRAEPVARRFAAAELHMRHGVSQGLTFADGASLDAAWTGSAGDPQTRYHLLSAVEDRVGALGEERLAELAREVLDSHGAKLELTSYDPLLVVTAARALGPVGGVEDLPRLEKHLHSNNTGVPKAALPSMADIDPSATLEIAARILTLEDLHPETRRVLKQYLEQEDGSGK